MTKRFALLAPFVLTLAACHSGGGAGGAALPGDSADHRPFSAIAPNETIRFTGTEPFWGGEAGADSLLYSTPENPEGTRIAVKRFAGRGGVSLSGELGGQPFDLMVSPGDCSDGMSDRTYPFVATLRLGAETRSGCAWTDGKGFIGDKNP